MYIVDSNNSYTIKDFASLMFITTTLAFIFITDLSLSLGVFLTIFVLVFTVTARVLIVFFQLG